MSGERVSVSRRGLAALLEAMREVWGDVDYLDGADGDEIVKSAAELQALIDGLERGDVLDDFHKTVAARLAPCWVCGSTEWEHTCRSPFGVMRGMSGLIGDAKKAPE